MSPAEFEIKVLPIDCKFVPKYFVQDILAIKAKRPYTPTYEPKPRKATVTFFQNQLVMSLQLDLFPLNIALMW
jgi:hypothetical protein